MMPNARAVSINLAFFGIFAALQVGATSANENVVGHPRAATISDHDKASAKIQTQRFFDDPRMLSERIRTVLHIKIRESKALPVTPLDGKMHPFTTKNANADGDISPINKYPWRAAGKMFMKFGQDTFVCTGSVIGKNLLVTAAHCVHKFGEREQGFADSVMFEPARHGNDRPFGTWIGKEWWIPKAYFEGTDKCLSEAPGIVCENDVAVLVLEKKDDHFVGDVTGKFGFQSDDYGYGDLWGNKIAQITQLGYPADNYDGLKMIRTDSLGYQDAPNNVIIGSAQTGGSSGGPWLQNFGVKTSYTGTRPLADDDNQVVATTSWGFNSDKFMIQGASRFGKNSIYTNKSNIQSLVDSACAANSEFC